MRKKAFIYIIIAGILWGTSGIFFNLLKRYGFSPLQMTAMRGFVAAISMALYTVVKNKKCFRVSLKELVLFAFIGLSVYLTAACYYSAINYSSVSTAVILMYTAPVFVLAYSVAFLGEKLNSVKVISVLMLIAGCALVSGVIGGMKFSALGIILGLSSGIAYSAYNVLTKIAMMKKYDSMSTTLYCFITMGIVSTAIADPVGMVNIAISSPSWVLLLIIGIGVFTCVVPYFLYTMALSEIDAGTASALGIIEPMSATIFSIVLLGEQPGIPAICGIILVLTAVFVLNHSESK